MWIKNQCGTQIININVFAMKKNTCGIILSAVREIGTSMRIEICGHIAGGASRCSMPAE